MPTPTVILIVGSKEVLLIMIRSSFGARSFAVHGLTPGGTASDPRRLGLSPAVISSRKFIAIHYQPVPLKDIQPQTIYYDRNLSWPRPGRLFPHRLDREQHFRHHPGYLPGPARQRLRCLYREGRSHHGERKARLSCTVQGAVPEREIDRVVRERVLHGSSGGSKG